MSDSGFYVGIVDESFDLPTHDNVVACCLDEIREGKDILIGFFSYESCDYANIFKFVSEQELPVVFFDRKQTEKVGKIDFDELQNQVNKYDLLYTETFDIVMMSKKLCGMVAENLKDDILEKKYLNTMTKVLKYSNETGLNTDRIIL
jgi:hypothetical protein